MKPFHITKLCFTCHINFALAITSHLDMDGYPLFSISLWKALHTLITVSQQKIPNVPSTFMPSSHLLGYPFYSATSWDVKY